MPEVVDVAKLDWWDKDERRQKALEMVFKGRMTYQEIAKALDISRMTLYRWMHNIEFMLRLETMIREATLQRKLRRYHTSTAFTEYLSKKIEGLIQEEIKSLIASKSSGSKPIDNFDRISKILKDYRAMRGEERADTGEAEVRVKHHVHTQTSTSGVLESSIQDVIRNLIDDGRLKDSSVPFGDKVEVVDAEFSEVEKSQEGNKLLSLVEDIVSDPEILASIHMTEEGLEGV